MDECIFCKIKEGEIPSACVYEDDIVYAFLDITQVTPGHTLVIPKEHVQNIFEYDTKLASEVFSRIPKISQAIMETFPDAQGMNIVMNNGEMAYQTVFHSHIHLLPRYGAEDGFSMTFQNNMESYNQEEFQQRAQDIHTTIHQRKDDQ